MVLKRSISNVSEECEKKIKIDYNVNLDYAELLKEIRDFVI